MQVAVRCSEPQGLCIMHFVSLVQHGMSFGVGDLSGDDGVYMCSIIDLKWLSQEDEQVHVRQPSFLELNGEDKTSHIPK